MTKRVLFGLCAVIAIVCAPEPVCPGARGSHAAHARSDARHRQRGVGRARDASRAGAGAVSAHPADLRVPGSLPRERSDGRLRQGVRLLERRDRVVPVAAAQLGADHGRAVAGDADRTEEAVRHPRRRGVGRGQQQERRRHRRAGGRRPRHARRGLRRQGSEGQGRDRRRRRRADLRDGLAARRDRRGRLQHAVSGSRRRRDSLVEHRGQRATASAGRCRRARDTSWSRGWRAARSCRSARSSRPRRCRASWKRCTRRSPATELDAGRDHLRPPLRGLSQAGRQRRQLRLRADARSRPRLHQAGRRREAAEAEAHDPLSLGARDQRHERLAHRAPRHRQARRRRPELRHGRASGSRRRAATGFCSGRPTPSRRS